MDSAADEMTSSKSSPWAEVLALVPGVMLLSALLHPRCSVSDCDAEAYLQGAHSFQTGAGYVSMLGDPLNHWPPGYSALLALFPDIFQAAWWMNLLSLGVAVAALHLLAFRAGWPRWQRLALSTALGSGFFLSLAQTAKPDILTYAVFLVVILACGSSSQLVRGVGLCTASLLIPVKLIAMVFAPAVLLSDLVRSGPKTFFRERWREVVAAALVWAGAVGWVVWFNQRTMDSALPSSHVGVTVSSYLGEVRRFAGSSFREGVALWHGSIKPLEVLIPYTLTLAVGVACLLTLRPRRENAALASQGLWIFGVSWALEVVRAFFAVPRLMGYGPLLVVTAWRPRERFVLPWVAYAALTCGLMIWNHERAWCYGTNDPVLVAEAAAAARHIPQGSPPVMTNALRFLDVHAQRASLTGDDYSNAPSGALCWWVLPDSGHPLELIPQTAPEGWTEVLRQPHSVLFRKP